MKEISITLSETDRRILESYSYFLDGLSQYLGNRIEIVLHSLENLDCSVIKILNGFYSGRTVGAPITDLALSMLSKINETGTNPYIIYFCKSKKNEPIKAATLAVYGEHQRIIGLVCMNFYLNPHYVILLKHFYLLQRTPLLCQNTLQKISAMLSKMPSQLYRRKYSPIRRFHPAIKIRRSS